MWFPAMWEFLSGNWGCGLEHRRENTEPAFREITSQVSGKLQEVRPHHHAEIGRRRRSRCPQLGEPGLSALRVVLPCQRAETGRFDHLARRIGCQEKARGWRSCPGDGVMRLAAAQHNVESRKSSA